MSMACCEGSKNGHVGYEGRGKTHVKQGGEKEAEGKRSTLVEYIFYRVITADPYLRFAWLSPRSL